VLDSLTDPKKYPMCFRNASTNQQIGGAANHYVVDVLKCKKVAIISDTTGYGTASVNAYVPMLKAKGEEIVYQGNVDAANPDLTPEILRMRNAGAEVVMPWSVNPGFLSRIINTRGPQGGSISVLLSNLYLHHVLDLWFERVVKCRLRGEARLVRYIDDFVICFQYRSDAIRVQDALRLRLGKFGLTLEPTKTKLVEFGRFAQRHAGKRGRKRPETIYFLGLTLYCTRNLKGNFKVGMRTEKSRLRRSLLSLQELMRRIRHHTIGDQVGEINAVLRGHYAYYGVAGNLRCLVKVYRTVERYWRRMLRSRSWAGRCLSWEQYHQIKARTPLLKPKLRLPYPELQALAVL
jgi:hypothetical protein